MKKIVLQKSNSLLTLLHNLMCSLSKTFKQNIDLYLDIITNMFNNTITECNFPNPLQLRQ